jgi:AcrR family transcriptional regulator
MPKRSDDYMAERRRHILDAAIVCANLQGWNSTTVDDVGRQAGLSKGAFYVHFPNKRALLIGLLERNAEEIEARAGIDSYRAFRADLLGAVKALPGKAGWLHCVGQLEAQVEGLRDPEVRALLARTADRLIQIFAGIISRLRPDFTVDQARARALGLIVALDGMASFRTVCDSLSAADLAAIVDRALEGLET